MPRVRQGGTCWLSLVGSRLDHYCIAVRAYVLAPSLRACQPSHLWYRLALVVGALGYRMPGYGICSLEMAPEAAEEL